MAGPKTMARIGDEWRAGEDGQAMFYRVLVKQIRRMVRSRRPNRNAGGIRGALERRPSGAWARTERRRTGTDPSLDAGRCLSRGRLPPPSAVHNSVPALTRAFVRCSPTVLSFSRARHVSPLDAYHLEYPTMFQPSRDSVRLTTAS